MEQNQGFRRTLKVGIFQKRRSIVGQDRIKMALAGQCFGIKLGVYERHGIALLFSFSIADLTVQGFRLCCNGFWICNQRAVFLKGSDTFPNAFRIVIK